MPRKPMPKWVREAIERRSGGVCEGCGAARATEVHHRLFRSRGGQDEVPNLIHLCGWGNHTGCHGIAHSGERGEELGWALRSSAHPDDQPSRRPVVLSDGEKWYLTADGRYSTERENEDGDEE